MAVRKSWMINMSLINTLRSQSMSLPIPCYSLIKNESHDRGLPFFSADVLAPFPRVAAPLGEPTPWHVLATIVSLFSSFLGRSDVFEGDQRFQALKAIKTSLPAPSSVLEFCEFFSYVLSNSSQRLQMAWPP